MKLLKIYRKNRGKMSPPARGRGLKPCRKKAISRLAAVAPRTGAWIETGPSGVTIRCPCVAPRTGAWIETSKTCLRIRAH